MPGPRRQGIAADPEHRARGVPHPRAAGRGRTPGGLSCDPGGQKIPAAELPARVAEILGGQPAEKRVLFLAADDRLNYEGVLRIIDLAKSGVEDLKIEFIATN